MDTYCNACIPDAVYADNDGMRNKEKYEGKGKGWACNNHSMRNLSLHLLGVTHVMIIACPSLAFAFMLLLISYTIITALPAYISSKLVVAMNKMVHVPGNNLRA